MKFRYKVILKQWLSAGGTLVPSEHFAMTRSIFVCYNLGGRGWEGVPLGSSEERSGMLLNMPRFMGQPFTAKTHPAPNASSAEAETPSTQAY